MENTARINANAQTLVKLNRLWRSSEARKQFEQELGLEPIITGDSLEVEAQAQSGLTEEYHNKFREWAVRQSE